MKLISNTTLFILAALVVTMTTTSRGLIQAATLLETQRFPALSKRYFDHVRPLIDRYCFECHDGPDAEAEIDLAGITSFDQIRKNPNLWIKVDEMLESRQMPPKKSDHPTDSEKEAMVAWVGDYLAIEAKAFAGDPGRVTLRRLNNSEYTYTIRDLTGLSSLDPTDEFPVDGAAGEGFINTGDALSISPSMIQKYLDAAKGIAAHAVLLPNGIQFSPHSTRRDWTDELLASIRSFYSRHTENGGGMAVNLQGIQFDTNQGGVLPVERYLSSLSSSHEALSARTMSFADLSQQSDLNAKYLRLLWRSLYRQAPSDSSILLDRLRAQTRSLSPTEQLASKIAAWQKSLWQLTSIGHIGREGGPDGWLVEQTPLVNEQSFSFDLPDPNRPSDRVSIHLEASSAGDGNTGDIVIWKNPRLTGAGQPDLPLRDILALESHLSEIQESVLRKISRYLVAAREVVRHSDIQLIASRHQIDPEMLENLLNYLDLSDKAPMQIDGRFEAKIETSGNYDFVQGWGSGNTPFIMANSSDQQVRIPGIANPNSVIVHPSPTHFVAAGWQSPLEGFIQVTGSIEDAHPECGNGVEWFVIHHTGRKEVVLWKGVFGGRGHASMPAKTISIREGEVISFLVGPRDGNHGCDLTQINLTISQTSGSLRTWDLAKEVSKDLIASNPHPDAFGNQETWHFYQGEMSAILNSDSRPMSPPANSLIEEWLAADATPQQKLISDRIQTLAIGADTKNHGAPDALMLEHFRILAIPSDRNNLPSDLRHDTRFGRHPFGLPLSSTDLAVQAPKVVSFSIPTSIAKGRTLITSASLDPQIGHQGSVQLSLSTSETKTITLDPELPIIVTPGSESELRWKSAFHDFRQLFPPVLCYTTIVPVDEVVTLTLFYREDKRLQRLMLDENEKRELNQLWEALLYVSREPQELVTAYEQITAFSTQDRPDLVEAWKPAKNRIQNRAIAFQERLIGTEPNHLREVLDFADQAWRRPLTASERPNLEDLYHGMRADELGHEQAIRLLLTRVLTAPAFLYRLENPGPDKPAIPVSNLELASRLSYFLWSSQPHPELRRLAEAGGLSGDAALTREIKRMLADPRARRFAIEFGCQWLHLRDFDRNDDKNETLYPEFALLRESMYEEVVRFITDLIQNNGSVLDLINANHTFLNGALASHYGVESITGSRWRRVDGVNQFSRGGLLGMASVLALQSGASRTSPILRGNWVSETLLGERLPRPPLDVPVLPEIVPTGLTAREMIERHSSAPACAQCHERIDPYGFALEQFDAIGRRRPTDVNTSTRLLDGRSIEGFEGLKNYLSLDRRDAFIEQFCRKLLGYALGRSVQLSDRPLLESMSERLSKNDYRFHSVVEMIATSSQFRQIRGRFYGTDE
ncbi:MAG: DUF1592 domain-containing protein [Verrucomicrobia bacterium]|nr:DUF1592 domain-containing protein [Verrucomicrobiota bacterium]